VVNYPAGLDALLGQGSTIVGYFTSTGTRVYHCMMAVSTASGRLFLAGIDKKGSLASFSLLRSQL
jgi:hypothetical protein